MAQRLHGAHAIRRVLRVRNCKTLQTAVLQRGSQIFELGIGAHGAILGNHDADSAHGVEPAAIL